MSAQEARTRNIQLIQSLTKDTNVQWVISVPQAARSKLPVHKALTIQLFKARVRLLVFNVPTAIITTKQANKAVDHVERQLKLQTMGRVVDV